MRTCRHHKLTVRIAHDVELYLRVVPEAAEGFVVAPESKRVEIVRAFSRKYECGTVWWTKSTGGYKTAQNRAARRILKTLPLRTSGETRGVDGDLTQLECLCLDGQSATLCSGKCTWEDDLDTDS
jgi:hypothetical protein